MMLFPQLKICLRPNNQITLTRGNYRARAKQISQAPQLLKVEQHREKFEALVNKYEANRDHQKDLQELFKPKPQAKLDIIQKLQRTRKAPSSSLNKPKNFTSASGQKLLESGAAMDIACKSDMRFCHEVTLTLPANTIEAFTALAAHTRYAINRLFQFIRRDYKDSVLWFFVWEYQKRGALHLHIALYHPDECEGLWISARMIEEWHKILNDISVRSNTCLFQRKNKKSCTSRADHQHHCQPITKSVAAYFAKYAGKQESKDNWYCQKYPVSRFWGSSKTIKEIIKANSFQFTFDDLSSENSYDERFENMIENILEKLSIVQSNHYEFCIEMKGKSRINRYQNGRKILVVDDDLCLCRGERYTFYCEQKDYLKAIELAKEATIYMAHEPIIDIV